MYINSQLKKDDLNLSVRFVYLRDQAFFKVQYFAGDRAGDLALCVTQEIKRLQNTNQGLLFCHTVGKTLGTGKTNEFTVSRMQDNEICPVFALERYVQEASHLGVNLKTGYLFRTLDSSKKNSDL